VEGRASLSEPAGTTIRAVFIITGLETGGAETMLLKLLERLDRSRFEPHVISLTGKGKVGPRIEALRIPVEALGMRPQSFNPIKLLRLVMRLRRLAPHLVHTWMYHADLLGGICARLAGIRAIGWRISHSNLDPGLNKRTTLLTVALCARLSSWLPRRILSCSEKARRVHVAAGYTSYKMEVVPNGFDLARFRPDPQSRESVRAELGISIQAPLIGIVSRFHPQKNIEGFVQAAAAVARARTDAHFLLVGSGLDADNAVLQAAIGSSLAAERFHLLGRRDDIPRLMAALDVLALSSNGEAFPNVVGEAMACGLPCAVTEAGDAPEIVGDTGGVVPVGDMPALARELLALVALPAAELQARGMRARERVQAKYDIVRVVEQYESFYLSLMDVTEKCAG
jgi:glycosyltransferase involved in cell wall biosynthesis